MNFTCCEPEMNAAPDALHNKFAQPSTMTSSRCPPKSALAIQLEQFNQGTFVSTAVDASFTSTHGNNNAPVDKPRNSISYERAFLRKLSKMIAAERWREMDEFLRSSDKVDACRSGSDLEKVAGISPSSSLEGVGFGSHDANPMEIVHYACRFNPPRTIVRHLTSLYPKGVNQRDKLGRLPLHHAAKWGASHRLIDYLLEKDRSAASVQDNLGKTPLHLLCENYTPSPETNGRDDISTEENMLRATRSLVESARDEINIEDNTDTTAIEYAIASDAPYDVVRFIQKASERDWKERKKLSSSLTHKQMEESLVREHQQKQQEQDQHRGAATLRQSFRGARPRGKPKTSYARTA